MHTNKIQDSIYESDKKSWGHYWGKTVNMPSAPKRIPRLGLAGSYGASTLSAVGKLIVF